MYGVDYFFELVRQTVGGVVGFWPVTLLLAFAWVCAFLITKHPSLRARLRTLALGCLPPFAIPVAILLCGWVFVRPWDSVGEASPFPGFLVPALLLAQIPLAGLHSRWWGERWPVVLASWVCAGYVSLWAGLMSLQSIAGEWL